MHPADVILYRGTPILSYVIHPVKIGLKHCSYVDVCVQCNALHGNLRRAHLKQTEG